MKVVILEQTKKASRERSMARFAAKARCAVGLRGELNIRLTSSEKMRKLNRRFRRKNQATDVLSFPSGCADMAGDIAISREIAAANAARLGHSTETEIRILILHGLLHLAGYDHESDDGEMQSREIELRQQLGLPAALIERVHARAVRASKTRKPRAASPRQGRRR
jgi:probable rRNA maturation factor